MKNQFKVGDMVKVENCGRGYTSYKDFILKHAPTYLTKWAEGEHVPEGTIGRVVAGAEHPSGGSYDGFLCIILADNGKVYIMGEKGLSLVSHHIIITTDGNTTTARLKEGKQTVKEAKAVVMCGDEYNQCHGSIIATAKAFDRDPVEACKAVIALCEKTQDKPTVREVKRQAKVGEWVKVVNSDNHHLNTYKNGDVLQCLKIGVIDGSIVYEDGGGSTNFDREINQSEYVVLENYVPPVEEKPKSWRGKAICVESTSTCFTEGKVYMFENGAMRCDGGSLYGTHGTGYPYETLESFNLWSGFAKFIEYKGEQPAEE